tara:strand:- start:3666 stop:5327 length:1662 start_codon:yes stop_codon:yes gene_type:complete
MHNVDRFIGELHQTVFNSFINKTSKRQLIKAPTGTGKTTAVINYADSNPNKKIVLLCPYQSLVDNIEKDNPNIACGYGSVFLNNNKTTKFPVTTYDSIEKIEDVDLYIVDEAHLIASHSSFREVIVLIMQTLTKVVFITATPEIVEDLFPVNNRENYVLEFTTKRPKQEARIWTGKYNVEQMITDIITNNKYNDKTVMIRVNSKKVIDRIIQKHKPTLKDKIAFIYSDEDNVLNQGQDIKKVKELKKGKISSLDFILCTSIFDVGLSFEVDRDIDCYAVSQDNRCMPNAIDMVQLLARVRENTGYKMNLTIIGNYQDYELPDEQLKQGKSIAQLCNEMANRYDVYSKLNWEHYQYILSKYNIVVNEVLDLKFKSYKVEHASRLSDTEIAKNFQNFPKMYETICGNLSFKGQSKQIGLITGDKRISGLKTTASVMRVYNTLFKAIELDIDFDMFIGDVFSAKKFKVLEEVLNDYSADNTHIFSNLVRGLSYNNDSIFNYKQLGLSELNNDKSRTIKSLYNMIYEKCNFRYNSVEKKQKKGVNKSVVNFVNYIAG